MTLETYLEKVRAQDKQNHWVIDNYDKIKLERYKLHKKFPYVITYRGSYNLFDNINNWCREKFGDEHGKCYWDDCEFSWLRWYKKMGFENQLENELDTNKDGDEAYKIIDNHFKIIEDRLDTPHDHSHKGIWATFFLKTGYDYGYNDYCFKNIGDAVYFKLNWHEEAERRR